MEQRTPQRRPAQPSRPNNSAATLMSAIVLSIGLIIAAVIVSGSVKKLTAAVEAQTFSSSLNSPSTIAVNTSAEKKYFTEKEAAEYLNMTVDEIKAAITKGEIEQYVKTSAGYSISKEFLDEFFGQKAYQSMVDNNTTASDES